MKYIIYKGVKYRAVDSSHSVTDLTISIGESQTSFGGGSKEYRADVSGKLDDNYFSFRAIATRSGKIKTPYALYDIRGIDEKTAKLVLKKSAGHRDFTF